MGTAAYPISGTFTGSIATTTLTITAVLQGDPISIGAWVNALALLLVLISLAMALALAAQEPTL
jgi:hypothetical protein